MKTRSLAFGSLFLFLGFAVPVSADEAESDRDTDATRSPHSVSEGGTLSFTFENDYFGNSDRNYTNGARISYVTPRNDLPLVGRVARRNLGWLTDAEDW